MKRNLPLLFVIIFILLVSGLFFWQSEIGKVRDDAELQKLSIGIVGDTSSLILIAKEKGFFKEAGLEVDLVQYSVGAGAKNDLLAGKLDAAVGSEFIGVRNSFASSNFKIIATIAKTNAFEVVARKDHGIEYPSDIIGKKITTTAGTAGEFWLGVFLRNNKIKRDDIELISLPPQDGSQALIQGQVDAMLNLEPHTYNSKKALGENAVSFQGQRGQGVYSVLFVSSNLVQNQPGVAEKLLKALVLAEGYSDENPDDAFNFVANYFGYDNDYMQKVVVPKYEFDVVLEQALILTMEDEARWMIESGLVGKNNMPNFLDYLYFDALSTIKPEAVTVIY